MRQLSVYIAFLILSPILISYSQSKFAMDIKNIFCVNILDTSKIKKEYRDLYDTNFKKDSIFSVRIRIDRCYEAKSSITQDAFLFYEISVIENAHNWFLAARLIAIGSDYNERTSILYDSGFFGSECGGHPDLSFGRVSFISLGGKPIISYELLVKQIACIDIPRQDSVNTLFHLMSYPYSKVFEYPSSNINWDKPKERSTTSFFPNGCADGNCAYLMVWTAGTKNKYETYSWNSDSTKLIKIK